MAATGGIGSTLPHLAAVGIGSNLDDPQAQIRRAFAALDAIDGACLLRRSGLYRSPPWGLVDQPWFVNAAAILATELDPHALHGALKRIEDAFGRRRDGPRWGPRVIDLDLLLYDERRIRSRRLSVPHPRMATRAFVLLPLAEIAADWRIPGGVSVAAALDALDSEARTLERVAP